MAERTTSLRPLIAPLRRDAALAPVAAALENAQVQLDALAQRTQASETAIGSVQTSVDEIEDVVSASVEDVSLAGDTTITKNLDGTLTISVPYVPPYIDPVTRAIGQFAGVQPVYEGPTGVVESFSDQPYLANPDADPPANLGAVSITRRFTAGETFYLHALAWARTGVRQTYQPHTLAPAQRWRSVTVTVDNLTGYPAGGSVTSLAATVLSSRVDQSGKQWAKIRVTYGIVPGLETYRAYAYLGATAPEDLDDWGRPLGESTGTRIDFEVESPEAGGTYQIAVTASARGATVPVMGATPTTSVTLDAWGRAPQVTSFFVQVVNVERQGVPVVELAFNFTKPSSTNWAAVKFQIREGVAGGGYASGSSWKDFGEAVTTAVSRFWGVAKSTAEYQHFRALSVSPAGKVNETDTPPTDFVTIGAGAGINLGAANTLSYTSDFAIVGNQLTIQGVNFGLAYGYDSAIFQLSAGAFTIKELGANKIVAGTLGVGVVYAGAVSCSQLTAGTASFSGDATFTRSGGGSMTLSGGGITLSPGGGAAASFTTNAYGDVTLSVHTLSGGIVSAASVTAVSLNVNGGKFTAGSSTIVCGAPVELQYGLTAALAVAHGGTGATSASSARTNLGLGTIATKNIGATGSFTTVDGKTVTVTDGIITAIT